MSLKDSFLKIFKAINPAMTPEQETLIDNELKSLDDKPAPAAAPATPPAGQAPAVDPNNVFAEQFRVLEATNKALKEELVRVNQSLAKADEAREAERLALENSAKAEKQKNIEAKIKDAIDKGKIAPKDTEGIKRWTDRLTENYEINAAILDEFPGNPALQAKAPQVGTAPGQTQVAPSQEKSFETLKAEAASAFETAKN